MTYPNNGRAGQERLRHHGVLETGLVAIACGLLACSTHAQEFSAPTDRLELSTDRYQTIEGWGTSLTWWAYPGIVSNPEWLSAYRELGANILRVDMQKEVLVAEDGDFRTVVPIVDDLDANIDRMDFTRSDVRIFGQVAQWLSENALEPDRVKIVGAVWTPPHWMKRPTGRSQNWVWSAQARPTPWLSGEVNASDGPITGDSVGGRLATEDPEILRQYGNYIASWVVGFERAYDVSMHAISIQNESTFENPFDSMVMNMDQRGREDFGQYAIALDAVRSAWRRHGLTTRIKGPHVAQIGPVPDNPWSLFHQTEMIDGVREYQDGTLIDFMDYFNSNYYMPATEDGAQATAGYYHGIDSVDADWARWLDVSGVQSYAKPVWFSETSGEANDWVNGPDGTAGNGAISVAVKVYNALAHADAVTYLYWLFTDDAEAASTESLLGRNDLADPDQSKKYAAYKHFSRYIRPGAVRIGAELNDTSHTVHGASEYDTLHGLSAIAFRHDQDETLTIVLLNLTGDDRIVETMLPDDLSDESLLAFRTSQDESFAAIADFRAIDGRVNVPMPPYSLVTITGDLNTVAN